MWVDFCSSQSFRYKINTEGGERGTQTLVAPRTSMKPDKRSSSGERGRIRTFDPCLKEYPARDSPMSKDRHKSRSSPLFMRVLMNSRTLRILPGIPANFCCTGESWPFLWRTLWNPSQVPPGLVVATKLVTPDLAKFTMAGRDGTSLRSFE